MIALLVYMYIIRLTVVQLPLIACSSAHYKLQRSTSQSLSYYVDMNAQFLQTNHLNIKFCDECVTSHSRKDSVTTSPFSSLLDLLQINIKALFPHSSLSQKGNKHPVPDKRRFEKATSLKVPVVNKRPRR